MARMNSVQKLSPLPQQPDDFEIRVPGSIANLGPGFDTLAVAVQLYLSLRMRRMPGYGELEFNFIDHEPCGENRIERGYRYLAGYEAHSLPSMLVEVRSEIPMQAGLGSSAAATVAGLRLYQAVSGHVSMQQMLNAACALEGHPDNAAACWLGGFVAAANEGRAVRVARVNPPRNWRAIVALPSESLATSKARAVLPASYTSADVVANIQAVSMLGLAFAQARGDLLRVAMKDRIHQPYRADMCPLLPSLLPLAGTSGILGVSLSGAGPAVLVIVERDTEIAAASQAILGVMENLCAPSLLICRFEETGANISLRPE